jgi:hypothetical protein
MVKVMVIIDKIKVMDLLMKIKINKLVIIIKAIRNFQNELELKNLHLHELPTVYDLVYK